MYNLKEIMKQAHKRWHTVQCAIWAYPGKTFADCLREAWEIAKKEAAIKAKIQCVVLANNIKPGDIIEYGDYCISIRKTGKVVSVENAALMPAYRYVTFACGGSHVFKPYESVNILKGVA